MMMKKKSRHQCRVLLLKIRTLSCGSTSNLRAPCESRGTGKVAKGVS